MCESIASSDPVAASICPELIRLGEPRQKIKSAADVYRLAVDHAVREAQNNFRRLVHNMQERHFSPQSPWLKFLRTKGVILPFIFDDLNPAKTLDTELLRKLAAKTPMTDLASLHAFVSVPGGLDIRFNKHSRNRSPHALQAFAGHEGNCLEFIYLYYGIALLTGLPVKIHDQLEIQKTNHVIASLGGRFFDPEDGRPLKHRPRSAELTPLDLMALYHYNNAIDFCDGKTPADRKVCVQELSRAKRYAPDNRLVKAALEYYQIKRPQRLLSSRREALRP